MAFKKVMRQYIKSVLQKTLLPLCYLWGKRNKINKNLVLLADSNCDRTPESMELVKKELEIRGYQVEEHFCNFANLSMMTSLKFMMTFMERYAQARGVFVCNYFVPVTACQKRVGTKVIQLWHSCGALKKFGYDAKDDVSSHFKGSVTRNFDLYTVSSKRCIQVFESAFKLEKNIVKACGVSRTDVFFDENYLKKCNEDFYLKYPQFKGKKILVYAPTFRGSAGDAYCVGEDEILKLEKKLGDDWVVLIKMHPRIKDVNSNCNIATNKLFAVADVVISDYSSLIFEYALFKKPMVLWVPDLVEYTKDRDFYLDFKTEIPCPLVTSGEQLYEAVIKEYESFNKDKYNEFINQFMSACDGKSTQRIVDYLES